MMPLSVAMAVATLMSIQLSDASKIDPLGLSRDRSQQIENSLEPNSEADWVSKPTWVRISRPPPSKIIRTPGTALELECEAFGSPAPSVVWLRDNSPITEAEDYENNDIPTGSEGELASVRSRLIINNILPSDTTKYACAASSGEKTAIAYTTVFTPHNGLGKPANYTEYVMLNREVLAAPAKPRIVLYYSVVMETIGTTLVIPCKIVGNPRPELIWMDNEDNVINNNGDPRMKIMSSGELIIHGLRWADMGGYTCIARNPIAKDSITTFVYPLLNEN